MRDQAVDTHCHLFLMSEDPERTLTAAEEAGVWRVVCVGVDPETSRTSVELAERFSSVLATAGVHPHSASEFDSGARKLLQELLGGPRVVGVGETGLDYYRRLSPPEDQLTAFRAHIAMSREFAKPLVVHVREAWEDAMAVLERESAERVVLHCFSGDEEVAREAQARGYFLSFAGNVTYPRADALRAALSRVDDDRLLVETDSPFLPPQPMRGKENVPANLPVTLEAVAALRGARNAEMLSTTTRNSSTVFPQIA